MSNDPEGLHQQLMDAAYNRWQTAGKGWSKEEFHDSLSAQERFAVHTGNLNYQVCNGGFMQWWDNRYGTPPTVDYLIRSCARIGTPSAMKVIELLKEYSKAVGTHDPRKPVDEERWDYISAEIEGLDAAFYDINEQFLEDCEAHLKAGNY